MQDVAVERQLHTRQEEEWRDRVPTAKRDGVVDKTSRGSDAGIARGKCWTGSEARPRRRGDEMQQRGGTALRHGEMYERNAGEVGEEEILWQGGVCKEKLSQQKEHGQREECGEVQWNRSKEEDDAQGEREKTGEPRTKVPGNQDKTKMWTKGMVKRCSAENTGK